MIRIERQDRLNPFQSAGLVTRFLQGLSFREESSDLFLSFAFCALGLLGTSNLFQENGWFG